MCFLFLFNVYSQPVNVNSNPKEKIEFKIETGQSIDEIIENLSRAQLIRSKIVFKIIILRHNLSSKIQAGYFYLSPSLSAREIAQSLTHAVSKDFRVTIPEGLRRQEIANLILDKLEESQVEHRFDPEEFIRLTQKLEGKLYPNTYSLPENPTTTDVLNRLTQGAQDVYIALGIAGRADLDEIITLASLIEREAASDAERPIIAGILNNRLKGRWPLQIDATVQFALANQRCRIRICDWWPKNITRDDLLLNSPYNTYKNTGLPTGPISNPGKESLAAAANPTNTNYWFYLHDPSGNIHYATSVEEHNKNVCVYLKKC